MSAMVTFVPFSSKVSQGRGREGGEEILKAFHFTSLNRSNRRSVYPVKRSKEDLRQQFSFDKNNGER